MRHATILLLLTIAIGLAAIANIGDEYIGSEPMRQFRKLSQRQSTGSCDGPTIGSDTYYYYSESIPTRIDSILTYSTGDFDDDGSNQYYEYTDYDDYYQVTETCYIWHAGYYHNLYYTCIYKYDLQDRILEYHKTTSYQDTDVNRILYEYDANGNLVLQTEYRTYVSETVPYRVTTTEYDAQNRAIHIQVNVGQVLQKSTWHTWGNHSMPDSTYIINNDPDAVYQQEICRNQFDENGERHYSSKIVKHRSSGSWMRSDEYMLYTIAHGIAFPLTVYQMSSYINEPDDPFLYNTTTVLNYRYRDDYHWISSNSETTNYMEYEYDDNWLLTRRYRSFGFGSSWKTITWEYYGSTPNYDHVAIPPAMLSAYPNPAKGMVNISLSKSEARNPVEAKVYNIKGQLVRSLEVSDKSSDRYLYNWDCKDQHNRAVPAGVYLIRIKTNSGEINKKVTILK